VVHHAEQAVATGRRKASAIVALACCGALLAGCGADGPKAAPKTGVVASVRVANCTDWKHGDAQQKRETVLALRRFASGPVGSSKVLKNGLVLGDRRAYRILDNYCAQYFARGFKLYKLYDRAATMIGHAPAGVCPRPGCVLNL
jgi:hypothetical protein